MIQKVSPAVAVYIQWWGVCLWYVTTVGKSKKYQVVWTYGTTMLMTFCLVYLQPVNGRFNVNTSTIISWGN